MKAEKHLMRQINLLSDRVDWREMFFELILAIVPEFEWEKEMPWAEREKEIVWREIGRRNTAAQFSVKGKEPERGHAETPFRDE
jgi:hypothetical protein